MGDIWEKFEVTVDFISDENSDNLVRETWRNEKNQIHRANTRPAVEIYDEEIGGPYIQEWWCEGSLYGRHYYNPVNGELVRAQEWRNGDLIRDESLESESEQVTVKINLEFT